MVGWFPGQMSIAQTGVEPDDPKIRIPVPVQYRSMLLPAVVKPGGSYPWVDVVVQEVEVELLVVRALVGEQGYWSTQAGPSQVDTIAVIE